MMFKEGQKHVIPVSAGGAAYLRKKIYCSSSLWQPPSLFLAHVAAHHREAQRWAIGEQQLGEQWGEPELIVVSTGIADMQLPSTCLPNCLSTVFQKFLLKRKPYGLQWKCWILAYVNGEFWRYLCQFCDDFTSVFCINSSSNLIFVSFNCWLQSHYWYYRMAYSYIGSCQL